MKCVPLLRGRKKVVAEWGEIEARNEVVPLQRFLDDFQRQSPKTLKPQQL